MQFFMALCALMVIMIGASAGEESVVHLTDENFKTTLNQLPLAIVTFYAPLNAASISLQSEYNKAAGVLATLGHDNVLAAVDVTENLIIAEVRVGVCLSLDKLAYCGR